MHRKAAQNKRMFLHGALVLLIVGALSFAAEKLGEGHLSAITAWIDTSGSFAPILFVVINAVGITLVLPQTLFTVVAGVLFGALKGSILSLISMALGSTIAFFLGRFVFRGRILSKFGADDNFLKLEMLSRKHPLKVLALSRIVPVVPYSVANYLWSVTRVRFLPYLIMSVLCLLPETVFLTAGGHMLSAGITKGKFNWEMLAVLAAAGVLIFILARAVRKSLDDV